MKTTLTKQIQHEFWKIGNTIFWSLNSLILLTTILDILILSKDWLELILLKLFLVVFFYITYKIINQKYGTPNLLIHLILFSFNFLALISISQTGNSNKLLYTTILIVLFVSFNAVVVWSVINSFIQYVLLVFTFVILVYLDVIIDPNQVLKEGGYVFLLIGFMSSFFPKARVSTLKERVNVQLELKTKIDDLTSELSKNQTKYKLIKSRVLKKENEYKFLFQQITNDINKIESTLKELEIKESQKDLGGDLNSLLQNLRNQSSIYFKPINLKVDNQNFLADFVDVKRVYQDTFKVFKNQMLKNNLHITENITDKEVAINANEKMFNTVLYNTLNFVVLSSHLEDKIEINIENKNETIIIRIVNKTLGLDTSEIESYFRDVEFVNYNYRKHSDSVKIGLRISKQLTEKMNGYFSYVSSEKMGYELKIQFKKYK